MIPQLPIICAKLSTHHLRRLLVVHPALLRDQALGKDLPSSFLAREKRMDGDNTVDPPRKGRLLYKGHFQCTSVDNYVAVGFMKDQSANSSAFFHLLHLLNRACSFFWQLFLPLYRDQSIWHPFYHSFYVSFHVLEKSFCSHS